MWLIRGLIGVGIGVVFKRLWHSTVPKGKKARPSVHKSRYSCSHGCSPRVRATTETTVPDGHERNMPFSA
jgi:hypothetical protein